MPLLDKAILTRHIEPLEPLATGIAPQGAPAQEVRCILFDVYGTLFISASGDIGRVRPSVHRFEKLKQLLQQYGLQKNPATVMSDLACAIKEHHTEQHRRGIDCPEVVIEEIWQKILKTKQKAIAKKFALKWECIVNPVYPMPNAQAVLAACRVHKQLMGIISNAQFYTPYLFKCFFDSDLSDLGFDNDLIWFSYRCRHAKPSEFMFKAACRKLKERKIPAASVLYVGNDMLNDIYAAQQVGFQTALFAGDARSLRLRRDDSRCRRLKANLVITDLLQLLDHLELNICD